MGVFLLIPRCLGALSAGIAQQLFPPCHIPIVEYTQDSPPPHAYVFFSYFN